MTIFDVANWVGTVSFALSGFLVGARKNLDLLGILIVSFLTAFGGGMLRDVLLMCIPIVLTNSTFCIAVIIVVASAILLKLHKKTSIDSKTTFIVADAVGLVSFAISGALLGANLGLFGAVIMGFITAVGGGIIRDMLINEVPFVLVSEFYGSVAIIAGAGVYLLGIIGYFNAIGAILLFVFCVVLRYIAWKQGWKLPTLRRGDES